MDWIVRQAVLEDRETVFPLVVEFVTSFKPQQSAFDASFARLIVQDSTCFLVAVQDTQIMGYCLGFTHDTFYANGPVAWVEEIMVQEAFRRHGVGEKMMQTFEEWAASRGASLVALATRRASAFYTALGYEDSAVYFRKILPRSDDDSTR